MAPSRPILPVVRHSHDGDVLRNVWVEFEHDSYEFVFQEMNANLEVATLHAAGSIANNASEPATENDKDGLVDLDRDFHLKFIAVTVRFPTKNIYWFIRFDKNNGCALQILHRCFIVHPIPPAPIIASPHEILCGNAYVSIEFPVLQIHMVFIFDAQLGKLVRFTRPPIWLLQSTHPTDPMQFQVYVGQDEGRLYVRMHFPLANMQKSIIVNRMDGSFKWLVDVPLV